MLSGPRYNTKRYNTGRYNGSTAPVISTQRGNLHSNVTIATGTAYSSVVTQTAGSAYAPNTVVRGV
jgi:hypothetical protein